MLLCRCILLKFYIKPQLYHTSSCTDPSCILLKFYIKPQLRLERELARCSCILLKFYIKPQQRVRHTLGHSFPPTRFMLYLIEILHQTTTIANLLVHKETLYLIEILHQTTTYVAAWRGSFSCILLKFYIKPQLFCGNI